MLSRMSLKKLWEGNFVSGSIHLSEPASAYDALRFVHREDYSNQGSYKCSDAPFNYSQGYSIYLPFYEGNWYIRNACMVPINDYNDISARSRQQVLIPSGTTAISQSWSGENTVANINVNEIYGIKYQDEDEYDPSKIYYDRTLLFSQDNANNSGMTNFNVSEDLRRFNFVEWEMNNPMANMVSPASAKYVTPFFMLQADTNWYLRATQWSATNNYTSYLGRQYMQDTVTTSSNNTIGNIPAPYQRNLNPMKVYGIGRKKKSKLTIVPGEHGTASASLMSGYPGLDTSTLYPLPDEGWYSMGYDVSGATLSGNQFMFEDEDVTVQPLFTDQGYPITYLTDGHGTLTGPEIAIPGQEVELSAKYNDYYRFNNYEVSGGTISGNKLLATGPCTVKANFKLNSFVASGNFEKGSNVTATGSGSTKSVAKYCLRTYSTSNVPSSWYSTSNRWKPTDTTISGYSMTINGRIGINRTYPASRGGQVTACLFAGGTQYQKQTWGTPSSSNLAFYSKSQTVSTLNVNYGVSAKFVGITHQGALQDYNYDTTYSAVYTSGTWRATGVIK